MVCVWSQAAKKTVRQIIEDFQTLKKSKYNRLPDLEIKVSDFGVIYVRSILYKRPFQEGLHRTDVIVYACDARDTVQ